MLEKKGSLSREDAPFWLIYLAKGGHRRIKIIGPLQLAPRFSDWSQKDFIIQKLAEKKKISGYSAGPFCPNRFPFGVKSAKNNPLQRALSPSKLKNSSFLNASLAYWVGAFIRSKAKSCSANFYRSFYAKEGKKL